MVGKDIHGGAAIHGPKEPILALPWTHFERLVHEAIVSISANFSTCMSVYFSSACMLISFLIFEPHTFFHVLKVGHDISNISWSRKSSKSLFCTYLMRTLEI